MKRRKLKKTKEKENSSPERWSLNRIGELLAGDHDEYYHISTVVVKEYSETIEGKGDREEGGCSTESDFHRPRNRRLEKSSTARSAEFADKDGPSKGVLPDRAQAAGRTTRERVKSIKVEGTTAVRLLRLLNRAVMFFSFPVQSGPQVNDFRSRRKAKSGRNLIESWCKSVDACAKIPGRGAGTISP